MCLDLARAGEESGSRGRIDSKWLPTSSRHLFSSVLNGPVKMPPQFKHEDVLTALKSQLRVLVVQSRRGGGSGTSNLKMETEPSGSGDETGPAEGMGTSVTEL